MAKTKVIHYS